MIVVICGGVGGWFLIGLSSDTSRTKDLTNIQAGKSKDTGIQLTESKPKPAKAATTAPESRRTVPDSTMAVDSERPDAAVPDAAMPDAAVHDAAVPDAAVPDTTASDILQVEISLASLLEPTTPDLQVALVAKGLLSNGEDRNVVAKKLNTRGMKFYKVKAFDRAVFAFELSHSTDPGYELAIYNRACVAGIQQQPELAADWLKKLKVIGTQKAQKALKKAKTDRDFNPVRGSPAFRMAIQ